MPELRLANQYEPLPPQEAFRNSKAFVRGYGGAMGGGKSRAMCEEALDLALDCPGIPIGMIRLRHNSITETTKRTMMEQVLDPRLIAKKRESGGEDYVLLHNRSKIHFLGLDDPVKLFSSEFGAFFFDEAHEIPEESVTKLMTRLRDRAAPLTDWEGDDEPLVGKVCLSFNPDNPAHWLYQWFLVGSDPTPHGTYKHKLYPTDAENPIGNAEFFFARALDNIHLPAGYIRSLQGQPEHLRRRYLEGIWEFIGGKTYFDIEALQAYRSLVPETLYRFDFEPNETRAQAKVRRRDTGNIRVFEEPVEGVAYAIGADCATGRGADYSCAYVIRLDEPKIVAEFHAKIDADLYAEQLHFLGRWFHSAQIAVETGGGYGEAVIIPLRDGKGPRPPYPRLYRHVLSSRPDLPVSKPYGFPMNVKTRPLVLSQLEKAIREYALPGLPQQLLDESLTFVYADTTPSPRALDGCNDDAVFAAAIALEMYRLRGHHPDRHRPAERERKIPRRPWQRRRRAGEAFAADVEARYPKGT